MGGRNSTRWRGHQPRRLVEEAHCIDLLDPKWKEVLRLERASGTLEWGNPGSLVPKVWIDFTLSPTEADGSRMLVLHFSRDPCEPKQVVNLEPADVGFSARLYARCPRCEQRVRKLFVAPGKLELCCRVCADLTYLSSRQHDRRIGLCRKNPRLFYEQRSHLQSPRSRLVTSQIYWAAMQQRAHGR